MRVMMLGDSQGMGLGPRLADRLGESGHTASILAQVGKGARYWTGAGRARLDKAISRFQPESVIAIFGTNDWPTPRFDAAIARIDGLGLSSPAIWIGSPRYLDPKRQKRADRMIAMIQARFGDRFIDSRPHTDFATVRRQKDGIHIHPSGLRTWAERIRPMLTKIIAGPLTTA